MKEEEMKTIRKSEKELLKQRRQDQRRDQPRRQEPLRRKITAVKKTTSEGELI
jgi:hypothetical protein